MSLVYEFREEIEQVVDDNMRGFVVESLSLTQEEIEVDHEMIHATKNVVGIVRSMVQTLDIDDRAMDSMTVAAILHLVVGRDPVDCLSARNFLARFQSIIGAENFDFIMRLVEGQYGVHSAIPQVMPQLDDAVIMWVLPFAKNLA